MTLQYPSVLIIPPVLTLCSHWLCSTCFGKLNLQGAEDERNIRGNIRREAAEPGPHRPFGLTCCLRLFASTLAVGWDEVSMVRFTRHRLLRRLRGTYHSICGPPGLFKRSVSIPGVTFKCNDANDVILAPVFHYG